MTFPQNTLKPSAQSLNLIKSFEGLRLTPYRCSAGHLTVGWGHKLTQIELRTFVASRHTISVAEAFDYLIKDTGIAATAINSAVRVPLKQYQFDALVSFVFNLGVDAFKKSTLLKKLNAGDVLGTADEFPRWNKEKNPNWREGDHPEFKYRSVTGLTRRRLAEKSLFLGQGFVDDRAKGNANVAKN